MDLGGYSLQKCGQCFRWQWTKSLKIGPLSKSPGPQIEKTYPGHAQRAVCPASSAPGNLQHEQIQPFCFINVGFSVCRYDLKGEFLTLDETWPCCHWQEPHRGKVCEVLALCHPDTSQILPWCVMRLGMKWTLPIQQDFHFEMPIKVVTGKGTTDLNFLTTHSTSTLWKAFRSSLQNLPIGNCR